VLDTFPLTEVEEKEALRQNKRMFDDIEKNLPFTIHHGIKEASLDHERKAMRYLVIDRIFNKHMVKSHARLEAVIKNQSLL